MKFWNWQEQDGEMPELMLNGPIDSDTWWGDEVTPGMFREELSLRKGKKVKVLINSPGGDLFAACEIYTMLKNHAAGVEVEIQSLAASAASVVAMAGNPVKISPAGMVMIHNPLTGVYGNEHDFAQSIAALKEAKQSIINAYRTKTNLSEEELSAMMDREEWMNAKKAKELGFVDEILFKEEEEPKMQAMCWSHKEYTNRVAACMEEMERRKENEAERERMIRVKLDLRKGGR